jgi:hypothetical protein
MSRGRRKRKSSKRPRPATLRKPTIRETQGTSLPVKVAKLDPGRTILISKDIRIAALPERCFNTITRQLEQTPRWDPLISDARPVSNVRGRIGATSDVTLNLGGKQHQSVAMISQYRPNHAISWIFSNKAKVMEGWQVEPKASGAVVSVTLAREVAGGAIGRFLYKITRWKRVEQDLNKTLVYLKAVLEGDSHLTATEG